MLYEEKESKIYEFIINETSFDFKGTLKFKKKLNPPLKIFKLFKNYLFIIYDRQVNLIFFDIKKKLLFQFAPFVTKSRFSFIYKNRGDLVVRDFTYSFLWNRYKKKLCILSGENLILFSFRPFSKIVAEFIEEKKFIPVIFYFVFYAIFFVFEIPYKLLSLFFCSQNFKNFYSLEKFF